MIQVLIIDDSQSVRLGLRFILESDPEIAVIGEARNGHEAVILSRILQPDIITMDIAMPGMDGYEAIGRIMSETPRPIIVITGISSQRFLDASFKALALGALTVLRKPTLLDPDNDEAKHLINQVKLMASIKVVRRIAPAQASSPKTINGGITSGVPSERSFLTGTLKKARMVAIGSSTGGPPALQTILSGLPAVFPFPVVIVQHISRGFTGGFARWLSATTPFRCKLGEHGEIIQPGIVYLAPDDRHMVVRGNGVIALNISDLIGGHRPSVDALFESVARDFKSEAVGVLLTGMGRDGARGLKAMRQAGAFTIAQDEASSVVYGMPRAAVELDAADVVLSLDLISPCLASLVESVIK